MHTLDAGDKRAFTLVELLVVIGIISVLIGILVPALSKARQSAQRTQCLSHLRSLAIAQAIYAVEQKNSLIVAGDASEQGSWIGHLQPYSKAPLVRKCPADQSIYYETPLLGSSTPPQYRTTSYGINNYVSPTHAPTGTKPPKRITQVKHSSRVIQFAELAEDGSYAGADHLHVQEFYNIAIPQLTYGLIQTQMPLGRHGGRRMHPSAVLNYSFIDGHAESLPLGDVYTSPSKNRFNPAVAE